MSIFEPIGIFFGMKYKLLSSADSTLYKIETSPHEYIGRIIYQDATVIKLKKDFEVRLVKILKCNIKCISIVRE